MSDDWIKMRLVLRSDPRTHVIAAKLKCHPTLVLGGLFQLWCLGDEHGEFLKDFTRPFLSQLIGIPGFGEALPADWLQERNGGIYLPTYTQHNGSTGKTRSLNARRQQKFRDKQEESNAESNAQPLHPALPREDQNQNQNQKRPEEKPPPLNRDDARAVEGYAREVVGLSVKDLVGKDADKVLVDFGLVGVVEMLEHLASRRPSERFEGARSVIAVCKSLLDKAELEPLGRGKNSFEGFLTWRQRRSAQVAKVGT